MRDKTFWIEFTKLKLGEIGIVGGGLITSYYIGKGVSNWINTPGIEHIFSIVNILAGIGYIMFGVLIITIISILGYLWVQKNIRWAEQRLKEKRLKLMKECKNCKITHTPYSGDIIKPCKEHIKYIGEFNG